MNYINKDICKQKNTLKNKEKYSIIAKEKIEREGNI